MPRVAKELSALAVKRLSKPGLYAVGGVRGLHIRIAPSGARYWFMRVVVGDRRRDLGIGPYPEKSLADARLLAVGMREMIRNGIDPAVERQAKRDALRVAKAGAMTFDACAKAFLKNKTTEFKNAKHAAQWRSTLETYASPLLGNLPVDQIELSHIAKVLDPIWQTKTETAARLRGRIEKVLDYAAVHGYRRGANPARWRGNLDVVLGNPTKIKKQKGEGHFRALPWSDVPGFMVKLRAHVGIAARALEFAILTAARSGEVRGATWGEIDLKAAIWTIPGERMKAGRKHIVPLSAAAVALLKALPRFDGSDQLFPAAQGGALSDMALTEVLRRMKVDATAHGFRSSFKDWARNCSGYADEVSELALAHVSTDHTRAAYARDGLLEQRRKLLAAWADYCNRPASAGEAKVIQVAGEAG